MAIAGSLLGLLVAACMPAYEGDVAGLRVAGVGDSITADALADVERELDAHGFFFSVRAVPGIDLADGRTQLVGPAVATRPTALVVELGINSASDGWDGEDLPHLEGILADVAPIPCVVWVLAVHWCC